MLQRQGALIELLEQCANIEVAVSNRKTFASLNRLKDAESLEVARQALWVLCLFKIVRSDHEVRVAGLNAGSTIVLLSASDISDIRLLALVLVPKAVVEAGNNS